MPKIISNKSNIDLDYPVVRPSLDLDFTQEVLDSRITFSRGSIGTRVNRNRLIETVPANQPRFDYDPVTGECKGLLIEESRTNQIRNNTMQGASVGNLPTNWSIITRSNLSASVVGTGVESGVNYVDIRISGVSNATNLSSIIFEGTSQIASSNGENWSLSCYMKIISGSTNGISLIRLVYDERSTVFLTTKNSTNFLSTLNSSISNIFSSSRYSFSSTNTNASTTYVQPYIAITPVNNSVIDLTLRIGSPQMELGSFSTSVIPTTTTSFTRSTDLARMTGTNFSSWYNQSEGTLYAAARINALGGSGYPGIAYVDDGTPNNCIGLNVSDAISDRVGAEAYVSGVGQFFLNSNSAIVPNQLSKVIASYSLNNYSAAFSDRANIQRDINGIIPTVNRLLLGDLRGGNNRLNGVLARFTYYPRKLKDNQLLYLTQ